MPELPEVETIVRTLTSIVTGATILKVQLNRTDILKPPTINFAKLITRTKIIAIHRRAKRIVFTIDKQQQFYIHLGMSGRLIAENPIAEIIKHTHLIMTIQPKQKSSPTLHLRFIDPRRFGGIFWLGDTARATDDLGPEPIGLSTDILIAQLAKTRRPIKAALLDQTILAGIGNIYADESLFDAAIHPLTPAASLTAKQAGKLNQSINKILNQAIDHKGSTLRDYRNANGETGGFQLRHKVYDRENQPCSKCKSPITRIILTGRSTCFCLNCQPEFK